MRIITEHDTVTRVTDVPIGCYSRRRLEVDFGLKVQHFDEPRETVDHQWVTSVTQFTAMGMLYSNPGALEISGGQNLDELLDVCARPEAPFTERDVLSLHQIWRRWHLNDMNAACVHMVGDVLVYEEDRYSPGGRRISCSLTVCPETGYTYGKKWLIEPLPGDVEAEVRRLLALAQDGA